MFTFTRKHYNSWIGCNVVSLKAIHISTLLTEMLSNPFLQMTWDSVHWWARCAWTGTIP